MGSNIIQYSSHDAYYFDVFIQSFQLPLKMKTKQVASERILFLLLRAQQGQ